MRQRDHTPPADGGTGGEALAPRDKVQAWLSLGTLAFVLARVPLMARRFFDPDEFEHAHAAWRLFKGQILYKDFFEHHTPWYDYVLRPLFSWFPVDVSLDAARHFLLAGRCLSLALAIVSLVLVRRIGRAWAGPRIGALAALLLVSQPAFLSKTLEIRPDVLALPFLLAAVWALLRGVSSAPGRPGTVPIRFAVAGLSLGAAVMCTQKMLFVLPGIMVGLAFWAIPRGRPTWTRVASIALFLSMAVVPGVVTWAAFVRLGAGRAFITNNFLLNAHWKDIPTGQLVRLLDASAPVVALACYDLWRRLRRLADGQSPGPQETLLACLAIGPIACVWAIPVAYMQYYLMALPMVCLLAATGLMSIIERARPRLGRRTLPACVGALALLPIVALANAYAESNHRQLALLQKVYDTTAPSDVVMDGWLGTGVFRPHAFYYSFIHEEILLMLPPARVDAFVDDLEQGRARPKLIVLDKRLAALGPRFLAFVNRHYTSRDGLFFYWAG